MIGARKKPGRRAIKTAEDDAMEHVTIKLLAKILAVAALAATILAMPASAQMGGKRGGGSSEPPKGDEGPKVDEKAYKAAMERIPAPKEKYDPWGVVAPAPAAPAAKKK
jgi:hypothetical protein